MAYPTAEQQETYDMLHALLVDKNAPVKAVRHIELTSKPYGNMIIMWLAYDYAYRMTIVSPDGTFVEYSLDKRELD